MMTVEEVRIVTRAWRKALDIYKREEPDAEEGECWAEFQALEDLLDNQFNRVDWS